MVRENNTFGQEFTSARSAGPSVRDGLTYLLIGGGIGAAIALLFAPKAGTELRGEIADVTRKGYDATLVKARELKDQSGTVATAVKEKADAVYNFASRKLSSQTETAEDVLSTAGGVVSDLTNNDEQRTNDFSNQIGSGRKASNII